MRIVVTGGAGFLGSHLCEALVAQGHDVVCVDDFSTGSKRNVHHLRERFMLVEHDILGPLRIGGDVERIYNLACPASPPKYQTDPVRTLRISTEGMRNVLELAREKGARVLQASTSEVYGDPLEHPQKESYRGNVNPIGPRACYDEGKRAAEALCFDHARMHRTAVRIARIFNTYGPRMDPSDGRIVSNFCVQALRGEPITIYGDGKQTRSFCYVSDLIAGLIALMESDTAGPVNLGNPHERTVLEMAQLIVRLARSKSTVVHEGLPEDDPTRRCPDIALARRALGWEPKTDLEEGLTRTLAHFSAL